MPAPKSTAARTAKCAAKCNWDELEAQLDARGYALPGQLLSAQQCAELRRAFRDDARFRATVDMAPRRFGAGRYRYFARPLPQAVAALRQSLYPPLARIANRWWARLGKRERFEPNLRGFLARCHRAGQRRPTPLLLRYETGGYNRLHQDLYGRIAFPLQVTILLSRPGLDFRGGEFLLMEQQARQQARAQVLHLARGEAVVFPNAQRPAAATASAASARSAAVRVRHGVSEVQSGERLALGIIFHDAE